MNNNPRTGAPWRVLIIGSGFAGLGMAIKLLDADEDDFLILEKGSVIGGTWRDNHYPGAACDVPSHLYSYSFAPNPRWTRKFADHAQIHAYMHDCVERYGLQGHIALHSEVAEAEFDAAQGLWLVRLVDGRELLAQNLISACGQLNRPAIPALPGIEQFTGPTFHSAQWRHDLDLKGLRVGVVGTGASAIQFVPRVQPLAAQLSLFQRSAPYVLPKPDRAYPAWERALYARMPWLQTLSRALMYGQHESWALAFVHMPWLMRLMRWRFTWHLRRQIADAAKRAALEPDYAMGCKRILISNDYYPALAQDNVAIVTSGIERVVADGIVTCDGVHHRCDVLIYGTGFTATDFLAPMQVRGLDGVSLHDVWREGAEAYKGISVAGFPNFYLLYGPNTNLGHNSILYMLESQFRYVQGCLDQQRARGLRYLAVRQEVQARFNRQLQDKTKRTVWMQGCRSWYTHESGKNTNNWPGFTLTYRAQTRAPEMADYDCV